MGVQQIKGLVIQNGIRTHKTKQGHLYSGEILGPANQNLRPYSATRGCSTQGGTREPSKKQCSPPKFSFESLSDRFEEWAEEPFFKRNSLNGSAVEGLWACLLALQAVPRSGLSSEPTSEVHRYLVCKILRIYSFITNNSLPDQKKITVVELLFSFLFWIPLLLASFNPLSTAVPIWAPRKPLSFL